MAIDTTTVAGAIQQVARHMSMVNGSGMTPYSPELVTSYLMAAHEFIKGEQPWDELEIVHIRTLDGTTGKITEGITEVTDWKDTIRIYHESSATPLPKVTGYNNALIATSLIGYKGLSRAVDPGPAFSLVQFYPLILAGRVMFVSKTTFDFNNMDLRIPIDWWLHVYHASWQYALDDGTNPGQIKKYELLFNERMRQVKSKENGRPVSMDPYAAIPDIWFEGGDPYWISSS
jgi:hypothetical protein